MKPLNDYNSGYITTKPLNDYNSGYIIMKPLNNYNLRYTYNHQCYVS